MRRDLNKRLVRTSRVLVQLGRLRRAARRVSKDEDQLIKAILYYFMPVESLLARPDAKDDPLVKEINLAGGIRPWIKQKVSGMKDRGVPRYQSLTVVYSDLKGLVGRRKVRMAAND